jgi:hypothetical protein
MNHLSFVRILVVINGNIFNTRLMGISIIFLSLPVLLVGQQFVKKGPAILQELQAYSCLYKLYLSL